MDIIDLIVKKLHDTSLSQQEEKCFLEWYQESDENYNFYKELEILKEEEHEKNPFADVNPELAWHKVMAKYKEEEKRNKNKIFIKRTLKYAAIFIIALSLGYGLSDYSYNFQASAVPVHTSEVTLESENGAIQVLSSDKIYGIKDTQGQVLGVKSGSKLDFRRVKYVDRLIYNTLRVPYGKKFEVTLSDGTLVYLNSGSSFRFPINFVKGSSRQVFLEGEGFFEVIKDKKHPFIVSANVFDIAVLGTKFNVSAYPEDPWITTVLVEGSVALSSNDNAAIDHKEIVLQSGDFVSWNYKFGKINKGQVDTDIYTSWIEGRIVFKNQRFFSIIKKLERHYDVKIINNYKELNSELFTATFDIETIEEVLSLFAENKPFVFKVKNKTITITKP
ncbi:FecR family protein [Flavobacterium sp. ARAG 55.4]|uniref:FecR family protein n=1 Tax=Flavobacterium sp. ARAG 55.4 TaxID=3451357 RepID=UPI003F4674CE